MPVSPSDGLPAWACVALARRAHIERVAMLIDGWARAVPLPPEERRRWLRAAWLHDALRDADAGTLAILAPDDDGPPELRHGPASAARAAADGEDDQGVLEAVRFHSVGYAGWDAAGRALYCADYLEPGREFDRDGRAALARRFPEAADKVVREVARARLLHLVRSGWPLPPPTVRFWNALAAPPSDSR